MPNRLPEEIYDPHAGEKAFAEAFQIALGNIKKKKEKEKLLGEQVKMMIMQNMLQTGQTAGLPGIAQEMGVQDLPPMPSSPVPEGVVPFEHSARGGTTYRRPTVPKATKENQRDILIKKSAEGTLTPNEKMTFDRIFKPTTSKDEKLPKAYRIWQDATKMAMDENKEVDYKLAKQYYDGMANSFGIDLGKYPAPANIEEEKSSWLSDVFKGVLGLGKAGAGLAGKAIGKVSKEAGKLGKKRLEKDTLKLFD